MMADPMSQTTMFFVEPLTKSPSTLVVSMDGMSSNPSSTLQNHILNRNDY